MRFNARDYDQTVLWTAVNQAVSGDGDSGDIDCKGIDHVRFDATRSTVDLTLIVEVKDANGTYRTLGVNPVSGALSYSIGPGCHINVLLTDVIRVRWQWNGTPATFSASLIGR